MRAITKEDYFIGIISPYQESKSAYNKAKKLTAEQIEKFVKAKSLIGYEIDVFYRGKNRKCIIVAVSLPDNTDTTYVFESGGHRNQIREVVKGVKVFSITQAFLKNTFVWLPPLPEQTAIANYLGDQTAKIDRLSDTVNQTIASLKEYRSALITQAVTGKIKAI